MSRGTILSIIAFILLLFFGQRAITGNRNLMGITQPAARVERLYQPSSTSSGGYGPPPDVLLRNNNAGPRRIVCSAPNVGPHNLQGFANSGLGTSITVSDESGSLKAVPSGGGAPYNFHGVGPQLTGNQGSIGSGTAVPSSAPSNTPKRLQNLQGFVNSGLGASITVSDESGSLKAVPFGGGTPYNFHGVGPQLRGNQGLIGSGTAVPSSAPSSTPKRLQNLQGFANSGLGASITVSDESGSLKAVPSGGGTPYNFHGVGPQLRGNQGLIGSGTAVPPEANKIEGSGQSPMANQGSGSSIRGHSTVSSEQKTSEPPATLLQSENESLRSPSNDPSFPLGGRPPLRRIPSGKGIPSSSEGSGRDPSINENQSTVKNQASRQVSAALLETNPPPSDTRTAYNAKEFSSRKMLLNSPVIRKGESSGETTSCCRGSGGAHGAQGSSRGNKIAGIVLGAFFGLLVLIASFFKLVNWKIRIDKKLEAEAIRRGLIRNAGRLDEVLLASEWKPSQEYTRLKNP